MAANPQEDRVRAILLRLGELKTEDEQLREELYLLTVDQPRTPERLSNPPACGSTPNAG